MVATIPVAAFRWAALTLPDLPLPAGGPAEPGSATASRAA